MEARNRNREMRNDKAILIDGVVTLVDDLFEWARWIETADRHVAQDFILEHRVSTVFLGLDHNYSGIGVPLWFETMVFGPPHEVDSAIIGRKYWSIGDDLYCRRHSTIEEARRGHARALVWLQERLDLSKKYQLQLSEGNRNEESTSGSLPAEGAHN
jgi:hypothetical protein